MAGLLNYLGSFLKVQTLGSCPQKFLFSPYGLKILIILTLRVKISDSQILI